jgi:hypothetical protein
MIVVLFFDYNTKIMRNFVIGALFIKKIIMNAYYFNITSEERQNILDKHKEVYNGYQALQPVGNNSYPIHTQDLANDKNGITVNNRGEVKTYTNVGINESVEKELDEVSIDDLKKGAKYKYKNPRGHFDGKEKVVSFKDKVEYGNNSEPHFHFADDEEKFGGMFGGDDIELDFEELGEISGAGMDVSDVESAYDFESKGPEQYEDGEEVDDYDKDYDMISKMFGMDYGDDEEEGIEMVNQSERPYTGMDIESILNGMDDIEDGKEMYSGEKKAYDFDSEGPVDSSDEESMYEEIEEDLKESFKEKHTLIKEMFGRMKKF